MSSGAAQRRRQRRLCSWLKHERMTVAMALADRDLRRRVDQIVDAVLGLPALNVLVPQMVDKPLALLAAFDVLVPEQVIKVPKMSTPSRCPRTVLSVLQTAEQLVEAPTIESLIDVIRQPVEQTVGGGGGGDLPGFLTGQSCSLSAEQIIDNPVPRRGFDGGLHSAFGEAEPEKSAKIPRTQGSELGADFSSWPP